jgi:signal transduction histidine kinase/DNA-binding response OmpR family regulator
MKTVTILIVHDDEDMLQTHAKHLMTAGYETLTASTGADGLRLAEQHRPDVVLLRQPLPDIDPDEIRHRLKKSLLTADTLVAFLSDVYESGNGHSPNAAEGPDEHIHCPVSEVALVARVQSMLRTGRAESELRERERKLDQRVKELAFLYSVSKMLDDSDDDCISESLPVIVDMMADALQYPDAACTRITLREVSAATRDFYKTPWHITVPVAVNDEPAGMVEVYYLEEKPDIYYGPFTEEELMLVHELADRLGQFVERTEGQRIVRQRNRELSLLNRIVSAAAAGADQQEMFQLACEEVSAALSVPAVMMGLFDVASLGVYTVATHLPNGNEFPHVDLSHSEGLVRKFLLRERKPLIAEDAQTDPRLAHQHVLLQKYNIASVLAVPLFVDDEILGVLILADIKKRQFTPLEVQLVQSVASELVGVVARERMLLEHKMLTEQYHHGQKLEALGRLTAGVAHDFNNALTAINGFAEILQIELPMDSAHQTSIQMILSAGQRAVGLVRQLLLFSRPQSTAMAVGDIGQLIDETRSMLLRIIGEDVQLHTYLADELWPIEMDTSQMQQVILNLCINARDAMPQGGELTLEARNVMLSETYASSHLDSQPGEHVLLSVTDTGVGMTEDVLEHLFEPFFSTKPDDDGTGLGLASTYGIVKEHGGHIEVFSKPGRGASFDIYLPRAAQGLATGDVVIDHRLPSAKGRETILLVEDDVSVRRVTEAFLRQRGYSVFSAASGEDALSMVAAAEQHIDLLLTDLVMPKMSGKELADRLPEELPDMKVLFMSGYSDEVLERHNLLRADVNFLQKPFSNADLARLVRRVLDGEGHPSVKRGDRPSPP